MVFKKSSAAHVWQGGVYGSHLPPDHILQEQVRSYLNENPAFLEDYVLSHVDYDILERWTGQVRAQKHKVTYSRSRSMSRENSGKSGSSQGTGESWAGPNTLLSWCCQFVWFPVDSWTTVIQLQLLTKGNRLFFLLASVWLHCFQCYKSQDGFPMIKIYFIALLNS